jgi:hypothetical protein
MLRRVVTQAPRRMLAARPSTIYARNIYISAQRMSPLKPSWQSGIFSTPLRCIPTFTRVRKGRSCGRCSLRAAAQGCCSMVGESEVQRNQEAILCGRCGVEAWGVRCRHIQAPSWPGSFSTWSERGRQLESQFTLVRYSPTYFEL